MKARNLFFIIGLLLHSPLGFALAASKLIKSPEAIFSSSQLKAICLNGGQCAPEATQAYIAKDRLGGRVFLIDKSRPAILSLTNTKGSTGYQVERRLDLAAYRHSFDPQAYGGDSLLTVYPALYPIGKDAFAIAVIASVGQGYSGGGAGFEIADFIPFLGTSPADAIKAVYRSVPFSCSQMVRACFGEKEHEHSKHCHDEREGVLTLDYRLDKTGGPDWRFKWHLTEWPAHVGKNMQKKRIVQLPIEKSEDGNKSYNAVESAEFCGGLQ